MSLKSVFDDLVSHADDEGLSYGIESIDESTGGILPGDFIIIGGPAHGGKTQTALSIAMANEDARVAVFTADEGPEVVLRNLLRMEYDLSNPAIRRQLSSNPSRFKQTIKEFEDRFYLAGPRTVKSFQTEVKKATAALDGIDLIIYDYAAKFEAANGGFVSMDWRMDFFKDFAEEAKIPMIVIHQSNRAGFTSSKPPTLADLKEAGEAQAFFVFWARGPHLFEWDAKAKREVEDLGLKRDYEKNPWRELWTLKNKRGTLPPMTDLFFSTGSRLTE